LDQIPERLGGFEHFVKRGVRAQWVNGVFPTLSYPSWTTLGTGSKTQAFLIKNKLFSLKYLESGCQREREKERNLIPSICIFCFNFHKFSAPIM
jgi:Type I phosphodiesterase / nucleotide pyrophosphatase